MCIYVYLKKMLHLTYGQSGPMIDELDDTAKAQTSHSKKTTEGIASAGNSQVYLQNGRFRSCHCRINKQCLHKQEFLGVSAKYDC